MFVVVVDVVAELGVGGIVGVVDVDQAGGVLGRVAGVGAGMGEAEDGTEVVVGVVAALVGVVAGDSIVAPSIAVLTTH